jgi:prepilin-type N-terminal cleavage/methylation domain-containing protein
VSHWFFPKSVEMEPHGQGGGSIQPNLEGDIPVTRWRILPPAWYRGRSSATGMNRRGTTLAELLIVIVIVGLAATLTLPNIGRGISRYKLKVAARDISNFLQETRVEAIKNADSTTPVAYRVVFDSALGTYTRQKYQSGSWANDGPAKTLPTNITIVNLSPGDTINTYYFRTDGSSVLDLVNNVTGLTEPTDDVFDAAPVTLRIQLQNVRRDRYEVNLFSSTGLTEIKEGWSS